MRLVHTTKILSIFSRLLKSNILTQQVGEPKPKTTLLGYSSQWELYCTKSQRRGKAEIPSQLFGKKQQGNVLVVDRSSTNRCLAEKAGFTLQLCWSHILDDSRDLAKNFGREGKYVHEKLKLIFADAKDLNHQGTEAQVKKLKERIIMLTKRKYTHSTVRKWAKKSRSARYSWSFSSL